MDFNTRLDPKCPEFVENNLIHKEITKKNITYIIILRCRSSFFQKSCISLHFFSGSLLYTGCSENIARLVVKLPYDHVCQSFTSHDLILHL